MNISDVKVGEKFSTYNKLVRMLGLPTVKGKQRELQEREISRYLSYEKTGKVSRGKVTNEIVITEIFDEPKEKIDNRCSNGSAGEYKELLQFLLRNFFDRNEDYVRVLELMSRLLLIRYEGDVKRLEDDTQVTKSYKYQYENEFTKKVITACKALCKKDENLSFRFTYLVDMEYVADEELFSKIKSALKKAREKTVEDAHVSFYKAMQYEKWVGVYMSHRYNCLQELKIEKIQKIFVFKNRKPPLYDNGGDLEFIDEYEDKLFALKELFRKRMLKIIPKICTQKEDFEEVRETHNYLFNSVESDGDYYIEKDDITEEFIKDCLDRLEEKKKQKEKIGWTELSEIDTKDYLEIFGEDVFDCQQDE